MFVDPSLKGSRRRISLGQDLISSYLNEYQLFARYSSAGPRLRNDSWTMVALAQGVC